MSQDLPAPLFALAPRAVSRLFADIENVLNLIDSDWGSLRQSPFPYTAALVDVQCLSAPVATGTAPGAGVVNSSFDPGLRAIPLF